MAYLVGIDSPVRGERFELGKESYVLGRHPQCEIHIDREAVSRQHARVFYEDGEYYVEDMRSRNFTYVNEERLDSARPRRLKNGDVIKIWGIRFAFSTSDASPSPDILFVDDDVESSSSTIMSKVGVSSDSRSAALLASPEVKLNALLEITRALGRTLVLDDVLPQVLNSLFKIFVQADRGFIALRNERGVLEPRWFRALNANAVDTIRVSRTIVNKVMETQEAILSADATQDGRFNMSESIVMGRIRSMMCAPLIDGEGNSMGVIQIDALRENRRFQQEDLEVLVAVANQASIAIDNARMHEDALKRRVFERDLELAHEVQRGFLPHGQPEFPFYEFFDFYRPAAQVGGDYFDYIHLPDGRIAIMVADVVGKGVAAALLMAKLSAEARFCTATAAEAGDAMTMLNQRLCELQLDRFVTAVLAILDPEEHRILVANAGHMPPLHRAVSGKVFEVGNDVSGLPLGITEQLYEQTVLPLEVGETVTMYTDGFNEACSEDDKDNRFGNDRIRRRIAEVGGSPKVVGKAIVDVVEQFIGDREQSDDMCLVSLGRVKA